MILSELINRLIELANQFNPDIEDVLNPDDYNIDPEVHLVYQPTWPLESRIEHIAYTDNAEELLELNDQLNNPENAAHRSEIEAAIKEEASKMPIVYVVEGSNIGYGSKKLWEQE